ncbi:hypothetical protein SAMN05216345_105248 [Cupriavidus sp. YR651]|nr:hypothetical protein SAMN05216345_105248 [Cupriavidus sp. YR651]
MLVAAASTVCASFLHLVGARWRQKSTLGPTVSTIAMSDDPIFPRRRSIRRFWNPVESRYYAYERPPIIEALCDRCGQPLPFRPAPTPTHRHNPDSGDLVLRGDICGLIAGHGACGTCGRVSTSVQWPEAARIKISVPEGILWSWNTEQLFAIRALVAGDKVLLRKLLLSDWRLARIVGRIPKFATLKRNRIRILRSIDGLLQGRNR